MKRQKQIEESKNLIADALLRLLETESLEDITISQIAAEARIGRNTFYNHFQKKADVLRFVMENLFADARKALSESPNPSLRKLLQWRFSLLADNPRLLTFQKEQDIRTMLRQFREDKAALFSLGEVVDEYTREFVLGGIDSVTSKWIRDGMIEGPEEMTAKVMSLIERQPQVSD